VLGTGLHAAAWLVYAEPDLRVAFTTLAAGSGRPDLSLALMVLGTPFWIAGIAVYVFLGRGRSPRLAWTGGILLTVGLTALATNLGTEVMTSFLVRAAAISPAQAAHLTRSMSSLPVTVMNVMFVIGVGLGIPLTAAALWRSGAVPRAAAALLVVFILIDIVAESSPVRGLGVVSHLVSLLAAVWIAAAVLRRPPLRPRRHRHR
jgi:hypothetical protein